MKGRQLFEISAQSGNFLNEPRIFANTVIMQEIKCLNQMFGIPCILGNILLLRLFFVFQTSNKTYILLKKDILSSFRLNIGVEKN